MVQENIVIREAKENKLSIEKCVVVVMLLPLCAAPACRWKHKNGDTSTEDVTRLLPVVSSGGCFGNERNQNMFWI